MFSVCLYLPCDDVNQQTAKYITIFVSEHASRIESPTTVAMILKFISPSAVCKRRYYVSKLHFYPNLLVKEYRLDVIEKKYTGIDISLSLSTFNKWND